MSYKIIDNYLPEEDFIILKDEIYSLNFPWYHNSEITNVNETIDNLYYQIHILYDENKPNSNFYDVIMKYFNFFNSLYRAKVNLYPNQGKFIEHPMHFDFNFNHKGALFSLNTCDGYTKLEDGTKIESVANRMLFFDSSKPHCSTNTLSTDRRVNINFNYF